MKRFCRLTAIILLLMANASIVFSDSALLDEEDVVKLSNKSQAPYNPGALKLSAEPALISENQVSLNVVSDQFPDIILYATIIDKDGNYVTGLTDDDIEIIEKSDKEGEGVKETITCFEEIAENGSGISFSLVFDVSKTMNTDNRLTDAKAAAIDFLNSTKQADRASLVTFSGCNQDSIVVEAKAVNTDSDSDGEPDINKAINDLEVLSKTAVFDGIAKGIDSLAAETLSKGVIIFTDGNSNNDCNYDITGVINKAVNNSIPVYTIGLSIEDEYMAERLTQIADETGGSYYYAPTAADMAEIYSTISEKIRNQYKICYTSHNPLKDGTTRTINANTDDLSGTGSYSVLSDNNPPVIDHTPVVKAPANQPLTISAEISDPDDGDSINKVTLSFRPQGLDTDTPDTEIEMVNTEDSIYTAEIPADQVTTAGLEYYINACDSNNACTEHGSSARPHIIEVEKQALAANAGPDQDVKEGALVTLDGSGTSAGPDEVLTYQWRQIPESAITLLNPNSAKPSFTAPLTGPQGTTLTFELSVTDSSGTSSSDTVEIRVNDYLTPSASFSWSPNLQTEGEPVNFTDRSEPVASPIVSWLWDFGGKGTSTEKNPVFTFQESGTYQVTLTVTDEDGVVSKKVQSVKIAQCQDCGEGSGGCFINTLIGRMK